MSPKDTKSRDKNVSTRQRVTVAFAEDMDVARQYMELLEQNEIDAVIKKQKQMTETGFSDIAIMVDEEQLDEAHALITERAGYDDFFDSAFNQPDYDQINEAMYDYDEDEF